MAKIHYLWQIKVMGGNRVFLAICHEHPVAPHLPWQKVVFKHNLKVDKKWSSNFCTKILPGRSHFRAITNTMANQEKYLRNSKQLSKLIFVKPLLRNPGWKSMFLLMLNRGSTYFFLQGIFICYVKWDAANQVVG